MSSFIVCRQWRYLWYDGLSKKIWNSQHFWSGFKVRRCFGTVSILWTVYVIIYSFVCLQWKIFTFIYIFIAAGNSEDSDYTSDFNYPICQQQANSSASQFRNLGDQLEMSPSSSTEHLNTSILKKYIFIFF